MISDKNDLTRIEVKTHPFQQTSQPQEFNIGTASCALFIGMDFVLLPITLAVDMVYDREVRAVSSNSNFTCCYVEFWILFTTKYFMKSWIKNILNFSNLKKSESDSENVMRKHDAILLRELMWYISLIWCCLKCSADQSEESASREWPVVSYVLPQLFYRAGWPDVFHLPVHPWYHIPFRRAFATGATGGHHPRHPPHALLPIVYPLFNLPQLHFRQDGFRSKHPAQHRDLLRIDSVPPRRDPRYVGSR